MGTYTVNANDAPYGDTAQTTFTDSAEAANLDQCTNGAVGTTAAQTASLKEPCITGTVSGTSYKNWVNGNANGNKAHWGEGDFISYRATITGLTTGSHTLVFSYDTVHSGTHSEDYLGSFDNTESTSGVSTTFHYNNNNPCVDQLTGSAAGQCTPSAPTTSLVMTSPTLVNCGGSAGTPPTLGPATFAPTREFKGWGPSGFVITSMSYVSQNVVSGTGQCSTTVQINFSLSSISSGSTVVIAWGGHIACACDWGAGNSASAISGSPYHMALVSLDGASTGSQDRALSTTAVFFAPTIGTVIKNASGTPVTSVTAGTVVHDTATLTGASSDATGTVTYNLYTTNTCTGSQVSTWPKTVTVANSVVPDSPSFTTTVGQFSFQAVYGGDSLNLGPATSGCEPLAVGTNIPTLTTSATPSLITLTTSAPSASDTANLSNGSSPTGSITFRLYDNSACAGTAIFTSTVTVTGNSVYSSSMFTPSAAGTYYWIASYSGDTNNGAVSTGCGDPGEVLMVMKAHPTVTTSVSPATLTIGGSPNSASDTATLSGGFSPTGSIIFEVFTTTDCSGTPVFTSTIPVTGNGSYNSGSFTPSSAGIYRWVATYTGDGNNNGFASSCGANGETLTVFGTLVKTDTCQTATAGKPFACTAHVTGGSGVYSSYTWFLPAGCSGSSTTSTITITCVAKGTYTISDTVADSVGNTGSNTFTVIVTPQPLVVTVSCPTSGITAGKPFNCTVSATGGTSPYTGIGTISRTEATKGTKTETFTVTDANGASVSGSATVTVAPQPLVVTVNCPTSGVTAGKPFSCSVSATGGTAPYAGTGSFSVTQPVKGTFTESFTVTDANNVSASGSATVTVAAQPLIVTVTCPSSGLTAGKPFNCTVSATGGTIPYTGMGTFSRTESTKGTKTESFTVTDANGATASGSASVTVAPQPLVVTVTCPTSGITAGKPFNCTVSAAGGTTPYSGIGTFSRTEATKGTKTESFTVTDANGASASGSASVSVSPQPLVVTVTCDSGATAGKPFNCTVSASGGTAPYSGTGTFSRTEATKGSKTETFTVTDANGASASGSVMVSIAPQPLVVTVTCDSGATAGKPFNCIVSATGGTMPYSGTGTFSRTEATKGTKTESFTVTDANGASASSSASVTVAPQPLVVTVSCPTSGLTAGKPFNCTVSATGGTAPYSGTGTFSVTEPVKGAFTESFSVTDANHATASGSASVTVAPQPLVVTVTCPSSGITAGKPFNCTVLATGGTAPYSGTGSFSVTQPVKGTFTETFSVTDANHVSDTGSASVTVAPQPVVVTVTCPTSGVTAGKPFSCTVSATGGTTPYSGTGTFSVTQPVKGRFTETFSVTDANSVTASGSASVTVAPQPLVVTVTCPSSGVTAGKPFSCTVSATGGTSPYSGTGSFSVTQPVKGSFTEKFVVTDANGVTASGSTSVTIAPQPLVVTVTCPTSGLTAGKPFDCNVSATGGTAPYSGTGSFTVTQPVKGSFTESFPVTDANGVSASGSASVTVAPQPLVVNVTCPSSGLTAGKPFSCTVSATGGTAPYSGTGSFSVTEPVKGTFTESFSVTDANHVTASASASVTVAPQPLVVTVTCDSGATAGKPFSCTVSATGGTIPYSGTGTFSVTQPVKGTFTESFPVTDANSVTTSGSATVSVAPQPLVVTVDCGTGQTAGKPFDCTVSATGGTAPYAGTGSFSVTQPVKGTFTESFRVTDANSVTASGSASVTVAPQPLVVTVTCPSSSVTAGKPFDCIVSATGGTEPYSGTGSFSVTQPVKGTFTETFSVTDANHVTSSGSASVTVAPQPLVVTVSCPSSGVTAGKPFSCTVSATGGTEPYSGTGSFSVTQPVKGTFTEKFSVTDANGVSASGSTSVIIAPQPLVVTVTCPTSGLTAGKPFDCTVSATGGTAPYSGTGSFTVTQPVKGSFTESFSVTDANGVSATGSASVTVAPQPLVVTVTCPTSGVTAGKPFDCTVSATGGTAPYSGTGTFSVTQPVKGTFTESFSVTDANHVIASGSASVTVTPQPLVVTVTCDSAATAGKPFNCTVSATGGTTPYTGTGTFSVTQPVKGTFSEGFSVTDSNTITASGSATVTVAPQPIVVTVTCPTSGLTAGKPFSCSVSATGGTSPYSGTGTFTVTQPVKGTFTERFSVTDANHVSASGSASVAIAPQPLVVTVACNSGATAGKPFNCTVSATGGTAPYTGTGSFTVTEPVKGTFTEKFSVTDANGVTISVSASVTVAPQPIVVTVTCPTSGLTAGKPFNCTVSATGGTAPYTGTGSFSVTQPVKGTFTEKFTVTDANHVSASGSASVTIAPQPVVVTVVCDSGVTAGKPFNCTVSATGGTAPYTGTGTFSLTEPVKGTFSEKFSVTDANSVSTSGSASVTVAPQPLVVTVTCGSPNAAITAGKPFNCTVSATGGTGPYSGTGTFSVTESVKGTYTERFTVTDANHVSASGSASVTVAPQPLVVAVSCPSSGVTAGKPFSCTVSASGGTAPYSGTGTSSVTQPVKGTFTETFSVTDANHVTASGSASVTVAPQPLVATVTCPTSGLTAGKPFSCTVSATGGTEPYSGTGTFSVTQPVKGTFTESFRVTDANHVTASGSASVTVAPQPIVVTVTCPSSGVTAGKPFSCTVSATGGTAPYSGTGSFSVTQPVKGTFTESFSVTDANSVSASGSASVTVAPQPLVVTVSCGTGQTAGKPFSCTVSATGGTAPYTGTGAFSKTEAVKGTYTETFKVTDANSVTASGSATVTVAAQPLVVTVTCPSSGVTAGKPFSCTVSATGGTMPYSGIGSFSVTQPVKGTFTESFSVTDANHVTASGSASVTVAPQPLMVTVTCPSSGVTAGKPFACTVSATGGTTPYSGTGSFMVTQPVKGTFTETYRVTDANGVSASGSATVTVAAQPLVVTVTCPSSGVTAGKPFSCTVSATGGTAPYTGTGSFTITQPVKGTFTERFSVTDSNGVSSLGSATVVVGPQPLVVTVTCPTSGVTAGKPFSCTVSATGGTAPYSGTGTFSLTQPVKGSFTESFSVTDANHVTASGSASVTVAPQPLVVTVTCPTSGITAGKPFSCTVSATGGTTPYSGTGTFSVTQPVKGSFTERFTVKDANGASASGSASVTVAPQPLVVTVICPSSGVTAGKPFSCTVSATGGTVPYTGTGTFTITQAVKGTFTEKFTVTDSNSVSSSGSATVTVAAQPLVVTVTCPTSGVTAGKPFSCTVSATGGTSPYTGTGTFTVVEPVKGTYTISYTVTDANGASAKGSTTVMVAPQPLVASFTSACTGNLVVQFTASVSGGTSPYSFSWNFGDGNTGTGNPVSHTYIIGGTVVTVSLTVTDANGAKTTVTKSVLVCGGQSVTDTMFCSLSNNQFVMNLISDPANPGAYQLVSTNPGQFYDNVFYSAAPGSPVSLTISIPFPFVTQGSNPIQVSSSVSFGTGNCLQPSFDQTSKFTITTAGGQKSTSGYPIILLGDYSPQQLGSATTITITGTVPASGLAYVTVHLSYGLRGQDFNKVSTGTSSGPVPVSCVTNPCAQWTANTSVIIGSPQPYTFTVSGSMSATNTVYSTNNFKKDPGFGGVLTYAATGNPIVGATIKIYDSNGNLIGITTTDQNGIYLFSYKYTGPQTTFTVVAMVSSKLYQSTSVTMQSNKLVLTNFQF